MDLEREMTRRATFRALQVPQAGSLMRSSPCPQNTCTSMIVVLLLWPRATADQVEYYVEGYRTVRPSTRILVLPCSTSSQEQLQKILDFMTWPRSENILTSVVLHLFGDHGASMGAQLLREYKRQMKEKMPTKAIIMDATPKFSLPWRSMSIAPRFGLEIIHILLMICYEQISSLLGLQYDKKSRTFDDLNDPALTSTEATKCYVFDETGKMFFWGDPAGHYINDGYDRHDYAVQRSLVDNVGRWNLDQERYWSGIESVIDDRITR